MRVYVLSSEVGPFAKTGGLADVAAALPKALAGLGHDVRVALPLYRAVQRQQHSLRSTAISVQVALPSKTHTVRVWEGVLPKSAVPVWFLECAPLFDRDGLYQEQGKDFPDNLERFSVFSQAALRLLPGMAWTPDIIHAHDWQAGLALAHAAAGPIAGEPSVAGAGRVFTIHNLAYQGLFPRDDWASTGLPERLFSVDGLEFYGKISCIKAGLLFAGVLTTVSPTYAVEIQTPEFGCGLDRLLQTRRGDLAGILNGIDALEWNPATDPHIAARFSATDLSGKARCRSVLQRRLGLAGTAEPVIGMIQRLVDQKGVDLFLDALPALMELPLQVALLGTGEPKYHEALAAAAVRYPGRMSATLAFDNVLAHQIEAGADAFLMPSRFEPCGLNQMYSMRYGTVPVVRRVGGLADTVIDAEGARPAGKPPTGFVFDAATPQALFQAVRRAVDAFGNRRGWASLMRAGMRQDFSWNPSAKLYVEVYQRVLQSVRGSGLRVAGKPRPPRTPNPQPRTRK
jgi:starch synthase